MIVQEFQNAEGLIYATVGYDEKSKCIIDTWYGLCGTRDNFRKVLTYIVHLAEDKKAVKWLADLRRMHGSFDDSRDWIAEVIMPGVIRAGLRYEAVVLPHNVFSKLSTKETILKIQNFELRQFSDIEKAKLWLEEIASTTMID